MSEGKKEQERLLNTTQSMGTQNRPLGLSRKKSEGAPSVPQSEESREQETKAEWQ